MKRLVVLAVAGSIVAAGEGGMAERTARALVTPLAHRSGDRPAMARAGVCPVVRATPGEVHAPVAR